MAAKLMLCDSLDDATGVAIVHGVGIIGLAAGVRENPGNGGLYRLAAVQALARARKAYYNSGYNLCLPLVYSWYCDPYYFRDADGNSLPDGTRLELSIEGYLDDGDEQADESVVIPLRIDNEAPILYTDEIAYLYNEHADTRRIEFYVSDNYDVAAIALLTAKESGY